MGREFINKQDVIEILKKNRFRFDFSQAGNSEGTVLWYKDLISSDAIKEIEDLRPVSGEDYNRGIMNSGEGNCGDFNIGDFNSGNWNLGTWNCGDWNSGDLNRGSWNSGSWNNGDWNSGDNNIGVFNCEKEPKIKMFDKDSDWTMEDWETSKACKILLKCPCYIYSNDDEQQKAIPHHIFHPTNDSEQEKTTDHDHVATAEEKQRWWDGLSENDKNAVKELPNFDAEKFYICTGIRVNKVNTTGEIKWKPSPENV